MSLRRVLLGFGAGFLATFLFHQGALALLHAAGLTDIAAYSMDSTSPLGVPRVLSLAFWGGVWGIALAAFVAHATLLTRYLLRGLIFGATAPVAVALLIIMPLKHEPVAAGGDPRIIAGAMILNGLWGFGSALLLALFGARRGSPSA